MQVVDARDPLTYRSEDLERYAVALHPAKRSLLLLNKADLLPEGLRSAWADHFDELGVEYLFWSAKAAMDEHSTGAVGWVGAKGSGAEWGERIRRAASRHLHLADPLPCLRPLLCPLCR